MSQEKEWKVFSILGAKVKEGKGMVIDASTCKKGVYVAVIENNSYKLIIK
ncbi:hypothetical protein [Mariniflexile sp.]